MYGFNKIYLQQIGNKMVFGWLFDSQYHFLTNLFIIDASADSQPDTTLQIMATSSMILLVAKLLPFLFEPKILTRLSTSWQYEAWPPSCCQMVESK